MIWTAYGQYSVCSEEKFHNHGRDVSICVFIWEAWEVIFSYKLFVHTLCDRRVRICIRELHSLFDGQVWKFPRSLDDTNAFLFWVWDTLESECPIFVINLLWGKIILLCAILSTPCEDPEYLLLSCDERIPSVFPQSCSCRRSFLLLWEHYCLRKNLVMPICNGNSYMTFFVEREGKEWYSVCL